MPQATPVPWSECKFHTWSIRFGVVQIILSNGLKVVNVIDVDILTVRQFRGRYHEPLRCRSTAGGGWAVLDELLGLESIEDVEVGRGAADDDIQVVKFLLPVLKGDDASSSSS